MKQIVLISRKWHHPKISMVVTDEQLSFAIDLADFITAIKQELGLNGDLDAAVDKVLHEIKGEAVKLV